MSRMRFVIAVLFYARIVCLMIGFPFITHIFSLCVYRFNKKLQNLIDKYYKYCNNVYMVTILHIDFQIDV